MEEVRVWDPRCGEDYTLEDFETKDVFSSLDKGLQVVEAVGVNWNSENSKGFLHGLVRLSSVDSLIVVIVPWLNKSVYISAFPKSLKVDYTGPNYILRVDGNEAVIDQLLSVRESLGGGDSGEWIFIGVSGDELLGDQCLFSDFSRILSCLDGFEFLIYMAEMHQNFIFTKPSNEVDSSIKAFVEG